VGIPSFTIGAQQRSFYERRTANGKRQTASKGLTANFERLKFSA
jgi:hypothetical protein